MHYKPTLTQVVINPGDLAYPNNLWCKSGHTAASVIRVGDVYQKMRFIKVSGSLLDVKHHGIYCEHCLIVANQIAKK
jgi:hypothetical protein